MTNENEPEHPHQCSLNTVLNLSLLCWVISCKIFKRSHLTTSSAVKNHNAKDYSHVIGIWMSLSIYF